MNKRLSDVLPSSQQYKLANAKVVQMVLQDDEATKRLVMHSAKRVIAQHKVELEKLADK